MFHRYSFEIHDTEKNLREVRQEKADTSEDIDLNDEDMLFLQCMH